MSAMIVEYFGGELPHRVPFEPFVEVSETFVPSKLPEHVVRQEKVRAVFRRLNAEYAAGTGGGTLDYRLLADLPSQRPQPKST